MLHNLEEKPIFIRGAEKNSCAPLINIKLYTYIYIYTHKLCVLLKIIYINRTFFVLE